MNRDKLMVQLKDQFGIESKPSSEFYGNDDPGIWVTNVGEIDGYSGFDYYAPEVDPNETIYVMGVHRQLNQLLSSVGWFAEPYDAGTWMLYPM